MSDAPTADIGLQAEYLKAIGAVTLQSAVLEMALERAIWVLLGLEELAGRAITTNLSAANRISLIENLGAARIKNSALKIEFDALCLSLREANKQRNNIVHAQWVNRPRDQWFSCAIYTSQIDIHPVVETVKPERIWRAASLNEEATKSLAQFLGRIQILPGKAGRHSWPPKIHSRKNANEAAAKARRRGSQLLPPPD